MFALLMTGLEPIATDGATVSFATVVEACVAVLPLASVWFAVTATEAESARAVVLMVVVHASAVQVGVALMPPTDTLTVRVFSEHVPLTT